MSVEHTTARVDHWGRHRIVLVSPLSIACQQTFAGDDFCPLCETHPSSGHKHTCPIIVDAQRHGSAPVMETEDAT